MRSAHLMTRIKRQLFTATNNARKRNTTEYATVGSTYTVLIIGLGASPQAVTHKPKGKEIKNFPVASSRLGRSFGPSRGKMDARLGARSHSVVVDDDRSMNKTRLVRDEGPPHAQSERANPSEEPLEESARPVRTNAQTEPTAQSESSTPRESA